MEAKGNASTPVYTEIRVRFRDAIEVADWLEDLSKEYRRGVVVGLQFKDGEGRCECLLHLRWHNELARRFVEPRGVVYIKHHFADPSTQAKRHVRTPTDSVDTLPPEVVR